MLAEGKRAAIETIDTAIAILAIPFLCVGIVAEKGGSAMLSFLKRQRKDILGSVPIGDRSLFLDILTDGLTLRNTKGESVAISAENAVHLSGILLIAGSDLEDLLKAKGVLWG